jgi:hypothetical protein
VRHTECRYCWTYVPDSECRTVWLSGLFPVICADCEARRESRAARDLELEESLALSRRGVRL